MPSTPWGRITHLPNIDLQLNDTAWEDLSWIECDHQAIQRVLYKTEACETHTKPCTHSSTIWHNKQEMAYEYARHPSLMQIPLPKQYKHTMADVSHYKSEWQQPNFPAIKLNHIRNRWGQKLASEVPHMTSYDQAMAENVM